MPLGNFATILPFLSPSSPPVPNIPPSSPVPWSKEKKKEEEEEKKKKKKPTLRICFPLKIHRGASSWWEYEEFRIEFRDRLMWRQAFGLDGREGHDTRDSHHYLSGSSASCYSASERGCGEDEVGRLRLVGGAEGTFYDDVDSDADDEEEERGMKSRWSSSSSSSTSSVDTKKTDSRERFASETVSAASWNRLLYLIPRLLLLTKADDHSTREKSSSGRTLTIKVGSEQEQQQPRPAPLKLDSKRPVLVEGAGENSAAAARPPPPSPSVPAPTSEAAEIRRHRDITLQKLEGSYIYRTKERYLTTFRSLFRTPNPPGLKTTLPTLPHAPAVAPLRLHSPSQGSGTCRMSSREWAALRDDIVSGLCADAEALFPFLTDGQQAAFMRVEQKEGKFGVEHGGGVAVGGGGVKEALERMERRDWEDVLFVEYEDTPRAMRWWYTTREPQVFEWGASMI